MSKRFCAEQDYLYEKMSQGKIPLKETKPEMRSFEGGATRNTDAGKLDYEGFLSPLVLRRYAEYLNSHRKQADGKMRDSDNWQKGIPIVVYMKSMFRHFIDLWTIHRGVEVVEDDEVVTKQEALCAVIFNAMGYLHELEKEPDTDPQPDADPPPCPAHGGTNGRPCLDCDEDCDQHPGHKEVGPIIHVPAQSEEEKTL
jgi:hypothetical protein